MSGRVQGQELPTFASVKVELKDGTKEEHQRAQYVLSGLPSGDAFVFVETYEQSFTYPFQDVRRIVIEKSRVALVG